MLLFSFISLIPLTNPDCNEDEWMCDYGQCIPISKRCDNNIDCSDDISDERNCDCKFNDNLCFVYAILQYLK